MFCALPAARGTASLSLDCSGNISLYRVNDAEVQLLLPFEFEWLPLRLLPGVLFWCSPNGLLPLLPTPPHAAASARRCFWRARVALISSTMSLATCSVTRGSGLVGGPLAVCVPVARSGLQTRELRHRRCPVAERAM